MNKLQLIFLLVTVLSLAKASTSSLEYSTPVAPATGKTTITLFDVWPVIDNLLKQQYWYYLRGANTLYEASVNSPTEFLYFTIYRNIVGTFLVITTWNKATQTTQINTFVRLGNGFQTGSGAQYDPVDISPFIVTLALGPDEYMVVVNADGTISVTGNATLYNSQNGNSSSSGSQNSFNVTSDMQAKCQIVDQYNRDTYWYYLDNATLTNSNNIPTSAQYYCVFVYVNHVGTFLSISHWDLTDKTSGINTFVRLGDGLAPGVNYGPVNLTPAILALKSFN